MKVYIASKTVHAPKWRKLRDEGVRVISTWIDEAGAGETGDWNDLWQRCVRESAEADLLVVYVEPGEVLKGALVEVGSALGNGVDVTVVWPADAGRDQLIKQVGSWVNHRDVVVVPTMAEALKGGW